MFDLEIRHVRKRWEWRVYHRRGTTLMRGRETTRREAKYRAYRAVFLLLASSGVARSLSSSATTIDSALGKVWRPGSSDLGYGQTFEAGGPQLTAPATTLIAKNSA